MAIPNHYKQVSSLGEGHFCFVGRYLSSQDRIEYAVKKLKKEHVANNEYRDRFFREVEILSELSGHDHIIDLIESESDSAEPQPWYVMPLANQNLYNYIKAHNNAFDRDFRIAIFLQIISAITYAHSLSLLHRDINPNNVLVFETDEGVTVKLSDFGLGKDSEAMRYTRTSASGYGQILYVAPEQKEHLKNADIRSDIYSLGKLLYFVVTGKDPQDILPCDFFSVIRKATQAKPNDRHQTIEEFATDFEAMRSFYQAAAIPIDKQTMKGYLDGKKEIDWKEFHEVAVIGYWESHQFHDYVWPVTEFFADQNRLVQYYSIKKSELLHFVNTLIQRIADIRTNLGWNFECFKEIGDLVNRIYLLAKEPDIKLLCICEIWNIAYKDDRWAMQRNFMSIINNNRLPVEIQSSFADFIVSTKARGLTMARFQGFNLPAKIRQAILHISPN
jgi:eukaryotic-like serine/threonine-protein kinase